MNQRLEYGITTLGDLRHLAKAQLYVYGPFSTPELAERWAEALEFPQFNVVARYAVSEWFALDNAEDVS
jgi:hypothetical protein